MDQLLHDLDKNFPSARTGDRARTASFINPNLQDLGICEWMEAYSCDADEFWILKRMEWKPGPDGQPAIHQHFQQEPFRISFGAAMYYLARYEAAQRARGYLPDPEDRGQCTGSPLFRDLAKAEGIPCDIEGNLVVPYKGHVMGSGVFPVDAFRIAAAGASKQQQPALSTGSMILADGNGSYKLSGEEQKMLFNFSRQQGHTIRMMRETDLSKLLENGNYVFGYKSHYHHLKERYLADRPERVLNHSDDITTIMPDKLFDFLKYQVIVFDFLASRILAAAIARRLSTTSTHPQRTAIVFRDALDCCMKKADILGPAVEKSALSEDALKILDIEGEFKKLTEIRQFIEGMARSVSIDLAVIPVVSLKESKLKALPYHPTSQGLG